MVPQRTVRTNGVVLPTPTLNQDLGFQQGIKDLSVQQFITQLAVETLHVAVLPGTARLNEQRLHTHFGEPLPHAPRRKLRTVVAPQIGWHATTNKQIAQAFQHLFAAVGYGAIGSTERAEANLGRAAATARANTRDTATLAVPGFAAYRAARWARRNPAQAAGWALSAVTAASTAGVAAGAAAGLDAGSGGEFGGAGQVPAGVAYGAAGSPDAASNGGHAGAAARAI